jgi:hypothetical protein
VRPIISIPYSTTTIGDQPLPVSWVPPLTPGLHSPDSAQFSDSSFRTVDKDYGNDLKAYPYEGYWKSSPVTQNRPLRPIRRAHTEGEATMNSTFLNPKFSFGTKARQIQDAKRMQDSVSEKARKKGIDIPDYEFYELIGKGTYGRVYKWLVRRLSMCARC